MEADKIGAKYGLSGAQVVAMISPNTNINTQYTDAQTLRFAYDPTEEAANRRQKYHVRQSHVQVVGLDWNTRY